ncbi:MAG: molybdopterin-dependent oxidoreductase [Nocardiaceae bacterium]|nr:molybdopterin-dependent oxidoreductase [Nocardiaceae bacterium]
MVNPRNEHVTACILCECNCGITVELEGRTFKTIRGDKNHPSSQGYKCEKALRLDHYQNGGKRLTSPLRRRPDGTYEEIDWDTAISEIAAKISTIPGQQILFYGGGGQGNHLGRTYATAFQAAVGSKYYSNALAQEKTGEMFVDGKMYGNHTKGDFEHAQTVVFVGKNPWQSHSFPRSRPVLKEIAADPNRTMIVLDPRRTETADLADIHLQVRPGTDAWCLAAMVAVLIQEDLVNHAFIAEHTVDAEPVLDAFRAVDVEVFAERCGVDADLIRQAARRIAESDTVATYEDLGIQQAPHSTLSSYLQKFLWILTGNFARKGTMGMHSSFAPLAAGGAPRPKKQPSRVDLIKQKAIASAMHNGAVAVSGLTALATRGAGSITNTAFAEILRRMPAPSVSVSTGGSGSRTTPVTGARIIGGLMPANSIPDEILTDHPDRFRCMWIDSSNPAHSLAESTRMKAALDALDLVVVVDVAFTETARRAHYVLPASSQFEKPEATFFNFEFPHNSFQLRAPILDPLSGTLAEPEIYARLMRELKVVPDATIKRLRSAAHAGRSAFAVAFFSAGMADPSLLKVASHVLYETLGETLPPKMRGAAALWGVSHMCATSYPKGVRNAGFTGNGLEPGEKLFEAVLNERSGVTFTVDEWEDTWHYVRYPDRRFRVHIPELVAQLHALRDEEPGWTTPEYPLVLAAGERRAFTANTIIRDSGWRRRDAGGSLRISPEDAENLGIENGSTVRVTTEAGSAVTTAEITDTLRSGHVTLPNGLGVDNVTPAADGAGVGISPNDLTSTRYQDPIAGTPWHKYVPARVEAV